MCILQRVIFIAIGAVALVAALLGHPATGGADRGRSRRWRCSHWRGWEWQGASRGCSTFRRRSRSAVPTSTFLVDTTPLAQLLPALFSGTGDCAKRGWLFLHLSIAEWALVFFAAIAVLALWRTFSEEPSARAHRKLSQPPDFVER